MLIQGDARMLPLRDGSVDCVVTSPPYFGGVRDYGHDAQIGLERQPADYVAALLDVGREIRRVLRTDGAWWLNLGDVYAASGKGGGGVRGAKTKSWASIRDRKGFRMPPEGFKFKDITLAPFLVADALRRDGWYLRSVVVWSKPVATEPPRLDRPSSSHEYLFLSTNAEQSRVRNPGESWWASTVWLIPPDSSGDHQATMPEELVRRCIVSSCAPGELVLDPFIGSGTVGRVAERLGRRWVGVDLNYHGLAKERTAQRGLFLSA
jgi:site-specific DNA-methyltransferase (cytosine-N4-specific)